MASESGEFKKPPLKRGLKKPPGSGGSSAPDDNGPGNGDGPGSSGTGNGGNGMASLLSLGSMANFSPRDAKQAFNTPASQILPGVYLGSQANAASTKQLTLLGATRVLDLKERSVSGESTTSDMIVHAVPMSDHGDTSIGEILAECFEFIQTARNDKHIILVHWYAGGFDNAHKRHHKSSILFFTPCTLTLPSLTNLLCHF